MWQMWQQKSLNSCLYARTRARERAKDWWSLQFITQLLSPSMHKRDCLKNLSRKVLYFRRYKGRFPKKQGTFSKKQGTFSRKQGTFSKKQGTFPRKQGTFSKKQRTYSQKQGTFSKKQARSPHGEGFGQVIYVFIRQPSQQTYAGGWGGGNNPKSVHYNNLMTDWG